MNIVDFFQCITAFDCDWIFYLLLQFSRTTQCWHFCTTINGNILEKVWDRVSFNANLHELWCFELELKRLNSLYLIYTQFRVWENSFVAPDHFQVIESF